MENDSPVETLPNIGPTLAKELKAVGILTWKQLADTGSAEAVLRIRGASAGDCINMLYAFEGAIQNTRWHALSREAKELTKSRLLHIVRGSVLE